MGYGLRVMGYGFRRRMLSRHYEKIPPKTMSFLKNPYISEPQNLHMSKKSITFAA